MSQELLKDLIISVILLPLVVIVARIVGILWRNVFIKIAHKTPTKLDLIIFKSTEKPFIGLVILAGFYFTLYRFHKYSEIENTLFFKITEGIFYVALVFIITFFVYSLTKAVLDWYLWEIATKTKTTLDEKFIPLMSRLLKILLVFIALIIILSHFKVNISGLLATAGIASLAFALAAQETIANAISGFMIMIDAPFRVGDRVRLSDGSIGDVYEIGLRSTKILSFDHTILVIPNSEIAKSKIINYTYPNPKVKIRQSIGVAYGTDIEKVKRILLEVCESHPEVLKDPAPKAYFREFGDSSLNLLFICWVDDYKDMFRITDELLCSIKKKFEEEKIEIPFPQRDIHIKT